MLSGGVAAGKGLERRLHASIERLREEMCARTDALAQAIRESDAERARLAAEHAETLRQISAAIGAAQRQAPAQAAALASRSRANWQTAGGAAGFRRSNKF